MFLPKQLYEAVLIIPQKYVDRVMRKLGKEKIVQIKEFSKEYFQIPSIDTPDLTSHDAVKALMRLDYMIEKLEIKKGRPVKAQKDPVKKAEILIDEIEKRLSEYETAIEGLESKASFLNQSLEFINSTKKLKLSKENFYVLCLIHDDIWNELLSQLKKENVGFPTLKKRVSGDSVIRLFSSSQQKRSKLQKIIEKFKLDEITGSRKDIEDSLKTELRINEDKVKDVKKELSSIPEEYASQLLSLKEQIELQLKVIENKRKFLYSEFIAMINLWVARSDYQKLKDIVKRTTKNNYVLYNQNPKIEDNPPTKLNNFFIFKPFEMLLETFSLAGYKDIDPTFIIAIFFPIFFGMMLSDAGYGSLLLAVSIFMLIKSKGDDFSQILLLCALCTIAAGVIFGSWFGFPLTNAMIDPLKKPIELMGIALGFGVFYVNLSLLIGFVQSIIRKHWDFLIYDILVWIVFEAGIVLIAFPSLVTSKYPIRLILLALPIVARILKKGILNILDFTKFFSIMISFIRLAALAMSTTWIAFAINLIYRMAGNLPQGHIWGVVILIGGHAFNFAFNTFGAFLQAMRLHYVEFLGQFYLGKGHKMEIFSLDKDYTL